jgi:hypothetical protein
MRLALFERERSETLILLPRKSLRIAADSWVMIPKFSRWKASPYKPSAPDPITCTTHPDLVNSIPNFPNAEVPSLPHLLMPPFSSICRWTSLRHPSAQLGLHFSPCVHGCNDTSIGGVAWTTGVYGLCSATIPRQETGLTFAFERMENCGIAHLILEAT